MSSKALEVAEAVQVPDLAPTAATTLTSDDVARNRLYLGQGQSQAVQDGLIKPGTFYVGAGADDPDPIDLGKEVTIYVVGVYKTLTLRIEGQGLKVWDFDDPAGIAGGGKVTYNYSLFLPDVDPDVSVLWSTNPSARRVAQTINSTIIKSGKPSYELAFKLVSSKREKDGNAFFAPVVSVVSADSKVVKQAASVAPAPVPHYRSATAGPEI